MKLVYDNGIITDQWRKDELLNLLGHLLKIRIHLIRFSSLLQSIPNRLRIYQSMEKQDYKIFRIDFGISFKNAKRTNYTGKY